MIKSLSVFFPVYNEEANLEKTARSALNFLQKVKFPWEIIIVDDGSTDNTRTVAKKLLKLSPKIRLVSQPNGGYGKALATGFAKSRYEWVVYTDADGQFNFAQIVRFLPLINKADAIWGYRKNRQDSLSRLIFGRLWRKSAGLLFPTLPRDVNCGFKMVKKSALRKILPLTSTRGAMINVELAHKLQRAGFCLAEVGVDHFPRQAGCASGASIAVVIKSYYELYLLARDA